MPGSILSIARTALLSSQKAVQVTSHNIANASTEGYTRQRADLVSTPPLVLPDGTYGTGVQVMDVERLRHGLLDGNFREQAALESGFQKRLLTLSEIEDVLAEPTDAGLAYALDNFWAGWSDLSNDPSDSSARIALRDRTRALVDAFRRMDGGFASAEAVTLQRLDGYVRHVNDLTSKIASLNQQIVSAEASGKTAGDLRDQRDLLTDQLAEHVPIHVVERGDGATGVYAAGLAIVDGAFAKTLSATGGPPYGVAVTGGPAITSAGTGTIGASLDLLNVDLPAFRQQLDDLAAGLVTEVNALHQTGTNPAGNTGLDFFDPAGVTARTIDLTSAILTDAQTIAAGTPDGAGLYQAGENDVALAMSQLRGAPQATLGGASFGSHYGDLVTSIGVEVASARSSMQAHEAIRFQADMRRSEVSGVSIDEEMINLMRFQTAYEAAARLVTTADEMMQSILAMV